MILKTDAYPSKEMLFSVPPLTIWLSSLFMGILASLPKILQPDTHFSELLVDSILAFLFSLFVWYYNIFNLPKYSKNKSDKRFFKIKLVQSLLLGIVFIIVLVGVHHLLFPNYDFLSMALMNEFRGILINLTICMFLYILYQSYQTRLIVVELQKVRSDHLEAKYELLKQQVNPHFLFNSLSTLKSMIEIGEKHTTDFIIHLSDFYRFSLENRKQDVIPLMEELKILHAYMFLLKARFEDGIHLIIELSDEVTQSQIPPFTLQLLVENCIKHNVISLDKPLSIKLYVEDDFLVIENVIQLKKIQEISTGMGLENINERYLHLIQKKIRIVKDNNSFKVKLPVIYEYTHY
ncbi:MAG: histidine kinase [Ginsengibacter sp.]|jgi:sensor histidine kinase YesM